MKLSTGRQQIPETNRRINVSLTPWDSLSSACTVECKSRPSTPRKSSLLLPLRGRFGSVTPWFCGRPCTTGRAWRVRGPLSSRTCCPSVSSVSWWGPGECTGRFFIPGDCRLAEVVAKRREIVHERITMNNECHVVKPLHPSYVREWKG